jgi:aspartate-semialdehyde dehydrogenase
MATYQAASGAGQKAMLELQEESRAILDSRPFTRTAMPFPYAFNIFTHNAPMTSSGYNEEEIKVVEEARKILEEPELRIAVTCVRVPVLRDPAKSSWRHGVGGLGSKSFPDAT